MKPEMIKTLLLGLQQEKKLGLLLHTRNQTEVLSLENTTLSIAKESRLVMLNIKSMLVILVTTGSFAISEG
jgi:hypothetical protein